MSIFFVVSLLTLSATVQDRAFAKSDTLQLSAYGTVLDRHDLLASPGAGLALTHDLDETLALDYLQAEWLWTRELDEARAVRRETGYVPNRERPRAKAMVGARYAFAYGKMLVPATDTVVHFIPELALHGGVLVTDEGARPALQAALGLRVRLPARLVLAIEYRAIASVEQGGVALGWAPALALGVTL